MLSDSPHKQVKRPPKKKTKKGHGVAYSDRQKHELVQSYLVTGNLMASAASLDIPYITAKSWKKSEWWATLTSDIKTEKSIVTSHTMETIKNKSLAVVQDRLENGEMIWDSKSGQLVNKPVSMKDAHKVAVDLHDRIQELENKPTETTSVESVEQRLLAIADKFAAIANAKPKVEVTDVITGTISESHPGGN